MPVWFQSAPGAGARATSWLWPDHGQITTSVLPMHGKPLGVSEVRGQMASGGSNDGSKHVDTEVAGGQIMVKACGHGSR